MPTPDNKSRAAAKKGQDDGNSTREYNPRWKGYLYIWISSLVNFSTLSGLDHEDSPQFEGTYQVSLMFGVASFTLTCLIIVLDRFQYCCGDKKADQFNYTKSMDGKIEGYTLLALTIWWIVGVGLMTKVGGVAYIANNIYFSCWLSLFASVYTLNKWSASKDILSLQELTGLSATLRSWYVLFLSSLVVMGTCCDLMGNVTDKYKSSASYGIVLGLISTLVALFFIMVHYRMIDYEILQVGGWIELSASFFMILLWIVGVAILTSEGGIAATMGGSGFLSSPAEMSDADFNTECFIIWVPSEVQDGEGNNVQVETFAPTVVLDVNNFTDSPKTATPSTVVMTGTTQRPTLPPGNYTWPFVNDTNDNVTSWYGNWTLEPTEAMVESLAPSSLIGAEVDEDATLVPSSILDAEILANTTNSSTNTNSTLIGPETSTNSTMVGTDPSTNTTSVGTDTSTNSTNNTIAGTDLSTNSTLEDNNSSQRLLQDQDVLFNATTTTTSINTTNETFTNFSLSPIPTTSPPLPPTPSPLLPTPLPTIPSESTFVPTTTTTTTNTSDNVPSMMPTFYPYVSRVACQDVLKEHVPGSNLYLASWICFFAAFNITLRWKAAQALQFAQARNRKADDALLDNPNQKDGDGDDADDNERDPDGSDAVVDDDLR